LAYISDPGKDQLLLRFLMSDVTSAGAEFIFKQMLRPTFVGVGKRV
jgi:hypothetical protein